jgi:uncharacterized protein (DUF983 family)
MLAIRKSAPAAPYRSILAEYTDAGNTGMEMRCPECGEAYLVYFGPPLSAEKATEQFGAHLRHEHADGLGKHRDGFVIGSQFPSGAPGV